MFRRNELTVVQVADFEDDEWDFVMDVNLKGLNLFLVFRIGIS